MTRTEFLEQIATNLDALASAVDSVATDVEEDAHEHGGPSLVVELAGVVSMIDTAHEKLRGALAVVNRLRRID